jgi:ATP-dependent exoDNAse (exonuclease V) beta subunit
MIHDQPQRQQALDPTRSFIVQAPAGSGKTELLIQRFLTLLTTVDSPEEILAITFTKKAASEMRARVIKSLMSAIEPDEPASPHAKHTWNIARQVLQRDSKLGWHLVQNPNQLRIQTIDSLCTYLTKQLPLLSHFGSTPEIVEDAQHLYRETVHEILLHVEENHAWSKAIANLLSHLDNDLNKLHDLLVSLLAKRDQWLPYIHLNSNSDHIKRELESHLAAIISDSLSHLRKITPYELSSEIIALARYAANQLKSLQSLTPLSSCDQLLVLPGTEPMDKAYWLGIAELLLTKDGEWRKTFKIDCGFPAASSFKNKEEKQLASDYKERALQLISKLQDNSEFKIALANLRDLPEAEYNATQWDILQSLLLVLKIIAAQLRVTFQLHGQIDFIQNAQAALEALGTTDHYTDLALALDYQIKHILVDEFQDTSLSQHQLLEKLVVGWENGDGRTLFVVGDPMQSIYRFREAEVGLFIRMRSSGIGHLSLIPLTLSVNFRSRAPIVEWNNTHFSALFPTYNDIATGAVTYSASHAHHTDSEHTEISVKGFSTDDENAQTQYVVELIQRTLTQYPNEKIAILVRSRPHLKQIIPALKRAELPYCAVAIDSLASRQHILDLLSLTCALTHPADRVSWLAILRAPWCGLTLADLLIMAGENASTSIWDRLTNRDVISQLSTDGQSRLNRVLPILKTAITERERTDLRQWIEHTWLMLGGPACLLDRVNLDDTEAFFKLLEKTAAPGQPIDLEKLKGKITKLYATAHDHDAPIQIMTIHSAKGLEFDTVILPHLEKKPAADDKSLLLWMERPLNQQDVALLLAPIQATGIERDKLYDYVNKQHQVKLEHEVDRLLYVATTRAKKRLHLTFHATMKDDGQVKLDSGSFLQKLWPLLMGDKEHILITKPPSPITETPKQQPRHLLRLVTEWKNPITSHSSTKLAIHQQKSGFALNEDDQRLIGIVIHRILQQLATAGIDWWTQQTAAAHQNYIEKQLSYAGILPSKMKNAASLTSQAISQTLADERGKWILHSHQNSLAEFKITRIQSNKIQHYVIDRTFIDENGIRWIIDYKTTTFSADDLAKFHQREKEKYMTKMQNYADAFRSTEDNRIKLGLYFPSIPSWHEWEAN